MCEFNTNNCCDIYTEEDLKQMEEFVDEMTRIHDNPFFNIQEDEVTYSLGFLSFSNT